MGRSLTLDVPDEVFQSLDVGARAAGLSIQDWAVDVLKSRTPATNGVARDIDGTSDAGLARLLEHCGMIAVGDPNGADNEAIDRDLAREYESTHEA